MPDHQNGTAARRQLNHEESEQYLTAKEEMERARAAYDAAKEAYEKGKQHDDERHAKPFLVEKQPN